ncbi:short chain dehydrogenase [Rhodobacterales bacterium 52_120_T64]|nr:short chain dehydrogenase [Rhodobacterales bacterium 52_120_T64]
MAALITGGAKRLGRAMALHLASKGHDVVIHYSSSVDDAEKTAELARTFGVRAAIVHANLLDQEATSTLVDRAVGAIEAPLDVLINNASTFEYDTLETATLESWDKHINSNLRAPVFLTQAFAKQVPRAAMDEHDEPLASACVINMVDMRVRKLTPEFATYTLAKAGLWTFTQTAAQFLAPHVRVNAIGPGPTMQGTRQTVEHFAKQRAATILERGSNPDEICKALDFILEIDGMTGQLICLDGGQHLAWKTPDVLGVE